MIRVQDIFTSYQKLDYTVIYYNIDIRVIEASLCRYVLRMHGTQLEMDYNVNVNSIRRKKCSKSLYC